MTMTTATTTATNLASVVPVETGLEIEQPLYDHVYRLRFQPFLRLSLHRVLVEAGLRHTARHKRIGDGYSSAQPICPNALRMVHKCSGDNRCESVR